MCFSCPQNSHLIHPELHTRCSLHYIWLPNLEATGDVFTSSSTYNRWSKRNGTVGDKRWETLSLLIHNSVSLLIHCLFTNSDPCVHLRHFVLLFVLLFSFNSGYLTPAPQTCLEMHWKMDNVQPRYLSNIVCFFIVSELFWKIQIITILYYILYWKWACKEKNNLLPVSVWAGSSRSLLRGYGIDFFWYREWLCISLWLYLVTHLCFGICL